MRGAKFSPSALWMCVERSLFTARDRELLSFIAEHRLVVAAQVQVLLQCSETAAVRRLRALARAGAISRERIFHGRPACYQIAAPGLALIDSDLPTPKLDLRAVDHDIGVAWLWLAARRGTFEPMHRVISERRMRAHDGPAARALASHLRSDPFGVKLGGIGPRGAPRLHYPDLLLVDRGGRRLAIELELSAKGQARRERIIGGYGADPRVAAVLYLTPNPRIARSVAATAARLGVRELIHVQGVRLASDASTPYRAHARAASRMEPVR